jgi:hypothetical protein
LGYGGWRNNKKGRSEVRFTASSLTPPLMPNNFLDPPHHHTLQHGIPSILPPRDGFGIKEDERRIGGGFVDKWRAGKRDLVSKAESTGIEKMRE